MVYWQNMNIGYISKWKTAVTSSMRLWRCISRNQTTFFATCFTYIYLTSSFSHQARIVYFTREEQTLRLNDAREQCRQSVELNSSHHDNTWCPVEFDQVACWPAAVPKTTIERPCPNYINMFDISEVASRYCTERGTWVKNSANRSNGNYDRCMEAAKQLSSSIEEVERSDEHQIYIPPLVMENLTRIQHMYTVGYSLSVIFLVVALIIMISLKRIHCPRNTIHMNVFVSFILRGALNLINDYLYKTTYSVMFNSRRELSGVSWTCKMLTTLWMYSRLSNYVWIFVEGFYLHTLIFINTFSHKSSIKWFLLLGWGAPLIPVIPWLLVRIYVDDIECWAKYINRRYRWIIEGPIICLILVNFIFFLVIIRLLFTKLRSTETSNETRIYRKLAKSTLVLIPLFGVHYVVFLFASFADNGSQRGDGTLEVIRFYFDSFFTSFQGLAVSILFCFMNGEVRTEIAKKWKRWRMKHFSHGLTSVNGQMSTLTTNNRASFGSEVDSLDDRRRPHNLTSRSRQNSYHEVIPEETCLINQSLTHECVNTDDKNHNTLLVPAK